MRTHWFSWYFKFWVTALQQLPASCPEHSPDFPRACMPWKSLPPICLAYMLPQRDPALVFVSSTWSSRGVSHPSTIQSQCCLTSVFEWELVLPTWHGPLARFYRFLSGEEEARRDSEEHRTSCRGSSRQQAGRLHGSRVRKIRLVPGWRKSLGAGVWRLKHGALVITNRLLITDVV